MLQIIGSFSDLRRSAMGIYKIDDEAKGSSKIVYEKTVNN